MSVDGAQLLEAPTGDGELLLGMFPGKTKGQIIALLGDYTATGRANAEAAGRTSDAELDLASRAYGNWQAYERRLLEMAGLGSAQKSLAGQFSVGTTGEQFKELRTKADRWKGIYEGLVPPLDPGAQLGTTPPPSRTTTITPTW